MQLSGIIRVFDALEVAEQARAALLADGFDVDAVVVSVRADEAGPVEGNFAVGNTPVESNAHVYEKNYLPTDRGHCLLIISGTDAASEARAGQILEGFGGRDPDPLSV